MRTETREERMQDIYGLTASQKSEDLLKLQTWNPEVLNDAYILTIVFEVTENCQEENLVRAYNLVLRKYDSLRLYFFRDGFSLKQKILSYEYREPERVRIDNWASFPAALEQNVQLKVVNSCPAHTRIVVCGDHGALILKVHHFLADGYTLNMISADLKAAYDEITNGIGEFGETAPSVVKYFEFQEKYLKSPKYKTDRQFWIRENVFRKNYLPVAKWTALSPLVQYQHRIDEKCYEELCRIKDEYGCSLEFLMAFAIALTVYRIRNNAHFSFSILGHGRRNGVLKKTAGNMFELFPTYWDLDENLSAADQIHEANRRYLEYLLHGQFPFSRQMLSLSKEAFLHGFNFGHCTWLNFSSLSSNLLSDDRNYRIRMISPKYNACHFFVEMYHYEGDGILFDVGCSARYSREQIMKIFENFDETIRYLTDNIFDKISTLRE